jgi:class 3 adenylate cyclase/predicted ATPase
VRCGACGEANPVGKRFCASCAAALSLACPACGAPVEAAHRFCGDCATPLWTEDAGPPPPEAETSRSAAESERRVCSVLFCDLVGFTPLSETRDPEEVRELLSRYFDMARTVVGRYGGVVEKFIGDAVMAVWGTPVASEQDAERAVRAALEVVAGVAQLAVEAHIDGLAARAGVVTGEVAVTLGASHEGMVAGDAVNTAARVQSAAQARSVLVDATTRRLAASGVGFEDAGEHMLKGKAEPERLFRATRVLSGMGGTQRVDGLEAPLVGRDAELRMVKELFHVAVDRRAPRLVVVSGPAGVGKSRLGWEFEKYVDGLVGDVYWHRGRCLSYGEGVAFWALSEIVRQRLGIGEDDTADVASATLANGLARLVPDPEEQAYVGTRLARLLGVPFDRDPGTPLARPELFAGWRLFLERLATVAPVLLLIEDAQHADSDLLDFLDHLIDWSRDLPIFVLVFGRSELDQSRPGFGFGRNRTSLTLDPLDAASMSALVDDLVPNMPASARMVITTRAQGLPLFAVETIRSLIDRDVVVPLDGHYHLVGEVGELSVPDSLHALLAARLDALDPDVRALLADASVLGSTFPAEALVAVSGRPEEEVRAALADVLRREVLDVSADPLSPERGTYRFAQEMLRQVAYDTLSRRDRKVRHLAVAAHLRTTFPGDGDEVMDVVARHYLDALSAVPTDDDIDQIRQQAITALVRAADRAGRTGSPSRAAASYATAAELAEDHEADLGVTAASLWEAAATAADNGGVLGAGMDYAARARDGYLLVGRVREAARAQVQVGRALRLSGRFSEAHEQLTAGLEVLRDNPDADTVMAMIQRASLDIAAGTKDAERLSAEALGLAQDLAVDSGLLAVAFTSRGLALAVVCRRPESAAYLREAARLAETTDDNLRLGVALLNLADGIGADDPAGAVDIARTAASYLRRAGNRNMLGVAISNLVISLLATGAWDEGDQELARAIETDGLGEDEYITCFRAWVAALRGDAAGADALLTTLHDGWAGEDPQNLALFATTHAWLAASRGLPKVALAHCHEVLSLIENLGISAEAPRWVWPLAARSARELRDAQTTRNLLAMLDGQPAGHLPPMLRAERELVRATLLADQDAPDADQGLDAAVQSLREMSTPYHLAHGLLDQAEHLGAHGKPGAASAAVGEARDIAERLRCRPLLDRAVDAGVTWQEEPTA